MLRLLTDYDNQMVELPCGNGSVLIPPRLNGRVFCQLDGELIHRLDPECLLAPSPNGYDNVGGNSLWPAPEGGPFAFNYLPGSDEWTVQEGVGKAIPSVSHNGDHCALVQKRISLTNRRGATIDLGYRRLVSVPDAVRIPSGYRLDGLCYWTEDIFEPMGDYRCDEVLLAPWSLEQFPGSEGILAFGKVEDTADAINYDFYDHPGERIVMGKEQFAFRLGGDARHQIGIRLDSQPQVIGALDVQRSLLIMRRAQRQNGIYFNIADNAQPDGPFSANDLYSIFNGGPLGFFELETIGGMRTMDGHLSVSILSSQTAILRGATRELLRYVREQQGVVLEEFVEGAMV
jgi:hypothetical protein